MPTVHFIDNQDNFFCIQVYFNVGSLHEPKGKRGIAHLLEHMKFKGTHDMGYEKINEILKGLGCQYNAYTTYDLTSYYIRCLADNGEKVTRILLDMLFNTKLSFRNKKEWQVVLEEYYSDKDAARNDINNDAFKTILAPSNPYNNDVIGEASDILSITIKDLEAFTREHYDKFIIVVNCPKKLQPHIQTVIDSTLSKYRITPKPIVHKPLANVDKNQYSIFLQNNNNSKQYSTTLVFKGYPKYHENSIVMDLLAFMIAHGHSSLLFNELREKRGLVYSVHCSHTSYVDTGFTIITFASSNKRTDYLIQMILTELKKIRKTLTNTMLRNEKEKYLNGIGYQLSDNEFKTSYLGEGYFYDSGASIHKDMERLRSISKREIVAILQDIFNPLKMGVTSSGRYSKMDTMMDSITTILKNIK